MEMKEFAKTIWNYEDVQFVAGYELVSQEDAEKFLAEKEDEIRQAICEFGINILEKLWLEKSEEE
jgi:NACalpha-BTF3-like transcription factor